MANTLQESEAQASTKTSAGPEHTPQVSTGARCHISLSRKNASSVGTINSDDEAGDPTDSGNDRISTFTEFCTATGLDLTAIARATTQPTTLQPRNKFTTKTLIELGG